MANKSVDFTAESIGGFTDNSGSDDAGEKQQSVLDQFENYGKGQVPSSGNNPKGATYAPDDTTNVAEGWGSPNLDKVIDLFGDPKGGLQDIADWVLLMTYAAGMFSHFATDKPALAPASEAPPPPVSVANIPMNPKVNYFYQSEWEYLLVGHKDANSNLNSVKSIIWDIRFVCNLITTFMVSDIETLANTIQAALFPIPFVGPALGVIAYFATHIVFAAIESEFDVMLLRGGHRIPLLKSEKDWIFSLSGAGARWVPTIAGVTESVSKHKEESGFSYEEYLLVFFFVTSKTDTLLGRMANLIEWNVINYKTNANANNMSGEYVNTAGAVAVMADALEEENCFRMVRRLTDFDATADIDLRLVFLTLPLFQGERRRQGQAPFSNIFPITVIDSRGY
jgi:hypothetical protein